MPPPQEKSFAGRLFERRPELRDQIASAPEFEDWKRRFRAVVIDDARYFVVGGDILKDEDELALDFARQAELVTEDLIAQEREIDES